MAVEKKEKEDVIKSPAKLLGIVVRAKKEISEGSTEKAEETLGKIIEELERQVRSAQNAKLGTAKARVNNLEKLISQNKLHPEIKGSAIIDGFQYVSDGERGAILKEAVVLPELKDTKALKVLINKLAEFEKNTEIVETLSFDVEGIKGDLAVIKEFKLDRESPSIANILGVNVSANFLVEGLTILQQSDNIKVCVSGERGPVILKNDAGDTYFMMPRLNARPPFVTNVLLERDDVLEEDAEASEETE